MLRKVSRLLGRREMTEVQLRDADSSGFPCKENVVGHSPGPTEPAAAGSGWRGQVPGRKARGGRSSSTRRDGIAEWQVPVSRVRSSSSKVSTGERDF